MLYDRHKSVIPDNEKQYFTMLLKDFILDELDYEGFMNIYGIFNVCNFASKYTPNSNCDMYPTNAHDFSNRSSCIHY